MRRILDLAKRSGYMALLLSNFASQAAGFAATLLVAKYVSPQDLAAFRLLQILASLSLVASTCGWGAALLANPNGGEDFLSRMLRASIFTSALPPLIFTAMAMLGLSPFSHEVTVWLPLFSTANIAWSFAQMALLHEQSQRRIQRMATLQILLKFFMSVAPAIATMRWGLSGYVYGSILASALIAIPLSMLSGFSLPGFRVFCMAIPSPEHLRLAASAFLANIVYMLGQSSDMVLIDILDMPAVDKGAYALASIVSMGAQQFFSAAQSIITPHLVSLNADSKNLYRQALRYQAIAIPITGVLALSGYVGLRLLVPLAFERYVDSVPIIGLLMLRLTLMTSFTFLSSAQFASGRISWNTGIAAFHLILSASLGLFLGSRDGILGIAVSQIFSSVATAILAWLLFLYPPPKNPGR